MKAVFLFLALPIFLFQSCSTHKHSTSDKLSTSSPTSKATNKSGELSCKLTTQEMQKRKETVLASLKQQVKETKELPDGYAFKFDGSDKVIDELTEFIKSERHCCDFFVFNLSIAGDKSEAWLELTGPEGAKDFVTHELGLVEDDQE